MQFQYFLRFFRKMPQDILDHYGFYLRRNSLFSRHDFPVPGPGVFTEKSRPALALPSQIILTQVRSDQHQPGIGILMTQQLFRMCLNADIKVLHYIPNDIRTLDFNETLFVNLLPMSIPEFYYGLRKRTFGTFLQSIHFAYISQMHLNNQTLNVFKKVPATRPKSMNKKT